MIETIHEPEAGTPLKGKSDIIKEHCSKNNIPIKEINISPEDVYKEVIPGKGVSNNGTGKDIYEIGRIMILSDGEGPEINPSDLPIVNNRGQIIEEAEFEVIDEI
jgi:hypothetical protein